MNTLLTTFGSTFRYDPLNKDTFDLRLIEIVPARDATLPILCRIHTYDIDSCPAYEALSYAVNITSTPFAEK